MKAYVSTNPFGFCESAKLAESRDMIYWRRNFSKDTPTISIQKLLVWLTRKVESPSTSMLMNKSWLVLNLSVKNPEGMFISSVRRLGIVAIKEASRRLS